MNYKTFIHENIDDKHCYKFTPEKKITDKITAMAAVEVYDYNGKKIGGYAFSSSPKDAFDKRVTDMVSELIREYETKRIWATVV